MFTAYAVYVSWVEVQKLLLPRYQQCYVVFFQHFLAQVPMLLIPELEARQCFHKSAEQLDYRSDPPQHVAFNRVLTQLLRQHIVHTGDSQ